METSFEDVKRSFMRKKIGRNLLKLQSKNDFDFSDQFETAFSPSLNDSLCAKILEKWLFSNKEKNVHQM
jgi:hypothetical protein